MIFFKSTKVKLFISFLATLVIIYSIIYNSTKVGSANKPMPVAENGVIDLRDWDFKKDGMIKLDGQWEFYSSQFLSPQDFANNVQRHNSFLSLPGIYADHGYATLRLKLLTKEPNEVNSIKIDFIQSAYKLWSNDQEIIAVGTVGISKQEMKPKGVPEAASFSANKGEVYLTLQVSNYYDKLGFIDSIVIGEPSQIANKVREKLSFDLFLFGCAVMAGIYNLGLFVKRKKNKTTLYSAIVCIIIAIRTIFLGERFIYTIFPDFSNMVAGKIMFWTFYLYIPFIVLFIHSFYDRLLEGWVVKISILSAYVYGILILISPSKDYLNIIPPFEVLTALLLIYMIYKVSKLYINNNSSDFMMVIGLSALLITRMNDILYEYSIIITGSFAAFGTLIFILVNSYLLAERQTEAFNNAENISEKLKSLSNLKDEFLAVTSHELKTPLNGIIGLSEILNDESTSNLSKDEKQSLALINTSAKRLSNLVNDITMFSKLKNEDIKLQKESVDMSKLADTVVKFCSLTLDNKNVTIVNLIDSSAPNVYGDKERIEQIFFNLVGNAAKFTSQGNIKLSYNVQDGYMEIFIEDSGIGIPENKLKSIFQIYEQVEGISEKYGGTGLGLYITSKLVELHGGTIEANSINGKGSTFKFTLPICKLKGEYGSNEVEACKGYAASEIKGAGNTTEISLSAKIKEISKEKNKHKILVVDDEYINQKVVERYLSKESFETLKASTGREALRLVEENDDIDLIILDMMMPDLLGCEVSSIIREKHSLFELPILIMTANSDSNNLVLSFECGANDYLGKPFNQQELLARVNTLITIKDSVQEAISLAKQVSEVKSQVEDLKESDKLKTELFTNLSHELRTPLNVICSSIQLLGSLAHTKQLGEERFKYYLNIMNQNSLRLLRLITNIIDVTKLEGNYLTLNLANGDIVYAVEELCQSVAEYIRAQDIAIIFDTEIEEKLIAFDEEKLERIILNILSNAVKFTDKGGSIYVNIYHKGDYVEISIRDTGIGIPEDKLDFIFERFAQLDKSLSRRNEGSGIGLSLVKSLVEMQGGKIFAKSKLGQGTEFIIQLPVRIVDEKHVEKNLVQDKESRYESNLHMEFSDIYME